MNKSLKKLFVMLPVILPSFLMAAVNPSQSYTFPMYKYTQCNTEHEVEVDKEGYRAPSRPVSCSISLAGGVEIAGYSGDIVSYEMCDAETGAVLAVFSDESGFVSHLLTLSGEYQVRFETPDYIFAGYIYL